MSVLKVLFIILEVLFVFNLLIVVHELGHYWAAKWRGLVVEKFGIWFGKPIWKKTVNGVQFSLGWIPAGGFVSLPQMAPMEAIEGSTESDKKQLPRVSAWDKIIVAFAGPLFSFGLAVAFACIVWVVGRPVSQSETTTTIGYVVPGSPAQEAGLLAGDRILSVDGDAVQRFSGMTGSVIWSVVASEGEEIAFEVEREIEGEKKVLVIESGYIKEDTRGWKRDSLREVGILPMSVPMVARVEPGGPAESAGVKRNDLVVAIDGEKILNPLRVSEIMKENLGQPLALTVQRQGQEISLELTPRLARVTVQDGEEVTEKSIYMLGVRWDQVGQMDVVYPAPGAQVVDSVKTIGSTLGALFSPKSDLKVEHLTGPVGILRLYYLLFESDQGWRLALWFSVVFNVNLALLNLLPIPVLDGGHIVIAAVEGVRRKPINLRVLEVVQSAFAILLIGFMLYITSFDIQQLNPFKKKVSSKVEFVEEATP